MDEALRNTVHLRDDSVECLRELWDLTHEVADATEQREFWELLNSQLDIQHT